MTYWVAYGLRISPAMAPAAYNQLPILRNKHYAMDGKIMALTVVAIFSLFILSLISVPCLRRRALLANSESSDQSVRWWSYPLLVLKRQRSTSPPETPSG